jgi:hypothetical protein
MEEFFFDCSPYNEPCAQLGHTNDFEHISKLEAIAMKEQLIRMFGDPPSGRFKTNWNSHEFGRYPDIKFIYPEDDEAAIEYAFNLEGNFPDVWDAEAKKFLSEMNYQL